MFLLLSLFFFFSDFLCLFFFLFFLFFFFSGFFWSGVFLFFGGGVFFSLCLMCVLVLFLIFLREVSLSLKRLSFFLVLFCVFFFFSSSFFFLYIFFELSIFPILFIILGFGSQVEKVGASYYLFFYSFFCSLPFLLVVFSLGWFFPVFFFFVFSWEFCFFSSIIFLMKFPLYFFHLWLPKAHVEAPTSARILLAGLLLKLGTGGFLRVLPLYGINFEYWLFFVSFLGAIVCCFICLFQSDLKSLAAYSSVNHIMFLLFTLLFSSVYCSCGGVSIMVSHGFVSTLLFFFLGEFYHSSLTRMLYFFNGMFLSNLFFVFFFVGVCLFNGGVPPSLSFFSEYLGIGVLFCSSSFFFFILFFYFFISFYYSLFVLVRCFVGKRIVFSSFFNVFFCFFILFWSANLFFFNFFF